MHPSLLFLQNLFEAVSGAVTPEVKYLWNTYFLYQKLFTNSLFLLLWILYSLLQVFPLVLY